MKPKSPLIVKLRGIFTITGTLKKTKLQPVVHCRKIPRPEFRAGEMIVISVVIKVFLFHLPFSWLSFPH